ncbi:glycosyl hydrolase [Paenibacillus sp. TRM 82003]|nr:glycosyl hydrolase [Paenibacillus sp. TRM 82003]
MNRQQMQDVRRGVWGARADQAQRSLDERFWNPAIGMYDIATPCPNGECNTIFHYWWMAHAVEALTDGLERTGDPLYAARLRTLYDGLLERNGGVWPNPLFDDMEWMAIGWLRAYRVTGEDDYKRAALDLWEDIRTGWNEQMGGGIAWQKSQLDYKNTPANAPAVILAARLYTAFGDAEHIAWAEKIYRWLKKALIDPETGFVWDGMNRLGDGAIDKDWKFTYCQGVFIGAAVELYRITGEPAYLRDAERTWKAALEQLTRPDAPLFPAEGTGDGGLFKGILARYAGQLAAESPDGAAVFEALTYNAETLWTEGRGPGTLFGGAWDERPSGSVELSTQLSAVILLETAAAVDGSLGKDWRR